MKELLSDVSATSGIAITTGKFGRYYEGSMHIKRFKCSRFLFQDRWSSTLVMMMTTKQLFRNTEDCIKQMKMESYLLTNNHLKDANLAGASPAENMQNSTILRTIQRRKVVMTEVRRLVSTSTRLTQTISRIEWLNVQKYNIHQTAT